MGHPKLRGLRISKARGWASAVRESLEPQILRYAQDDNLYQNDNVCFKGDCWNELFAGCEAV